MDATELRRLFSVLHWSDRDERDGLITIDAVYVDGRSLSQGTLWAQSLAAGIANEAETKLNTVGNPLRERVLEREAA